MALNPRPRLPSPYQAGMSGMVPTRLQNTGGLNLSNLTAVRRDPIPQGPGGSRDGIIGPVGGGGPTGPPPTPDPNRQSYPYGDTSTFGPTSTIRNTQILPNQRYGSIAGSDVSGAQDAIRRATAATGAANPNSPEAARARALAAQRLESLSGPNRDELANRTFANLRSSTEPDFQMELQGVGRQAAALGRIGSGVTTSNLGDVQSERERFLSEAQERLSIDSAQQQMQDQLNALSASLGASGAFSGEDLARANFGLDQSGEERAIAGAIEGLQRRSRDEMVGERDFAYGQDRDYRNEFRDERDYQDIQSRYGVDDAYRNRALEAIYAFMQGNSGGANFDPYGLGSIDNASDWISGLFGRGTRTSGTPGPERGLIRNAVATPRGTSFNPELAGQDPSVLARRLPPELLRYLQGPSGGPGRTPRRPPPEPQNSGGGMSEEQINEYNRHLGNTPMTLKDWANPDYWGSTNFGAFTSALSPALGYDLTDPKANRLNADDAASMDSAAEAIRAAGQGLSPEEREALLRRYGDWLQSYTSTGGQQMDQERERERLANWQW